MPMPSQLRSGKRRNHKRPVFEELPSLDMRWLGPPRHGSEGLEPPRLSQLQLA
jgi:hypothetical protein